MHVRRQVIRFGLCALACASAAPAIWAQGKPRLKLRYSEVIRSIFFAPTYVAAAKGYFDEVGLDVSFTTANAPDKLAAALLGGSADVGLVGTDAAIHVYNSASPTKLLIFAGLTTTDGFMLVGREKMDKFDWNMLRGKDVLATLPGALPLMYLHAALRKNGLDPLKDLQLVSNTATPARMGSWLAGQNQFATFAEPDTAQLEGDGKAFFLASIGQTVGPAEYTTFLATDKFLRESPEAARAWVTAIAKAQAWTSVAASAEIADAVKPYFPAIALSALVAGIERNRRFGIWKINPAVGAAGIEKVQDVMVQGGVLAEAKRVKFAELVRNEFTSRVG